MQTGSYSYFGQWDAYAAGLDTANNYGVLVNIDHKQTVMDWTLPIWQPITGHYNCPEQTDTAASCGVDLQTATELPKVIMYRIWQIATEMKL